MLADLLIAWFRQHARKLPWRENTTSPWGILVSEVMLQQTPVVRVAPVWQEWLQRWPQPADLAAADSGEVLSRWQGLGYPRRALRLQQCAQAIAAKHGGAVPQTYAELRALPGIGDYTAAAVMAFAFNRRTVVLDTNIRRVLSRAISGQQWPSSSVTVAERALAEEQLPGGPEPTDANPHPIHVNAATYNVAVMELGALICRPNPLCDQCPLAAVCAWRADGYPASPQPRKAQPFHGTDRQVRGRIMRSLSAAWPAGVPTTELRTVCDDVSQFERALAGLLTDGLLEKRRGGQIALPASTPNSV